jgi:hypothetical protein
MMTILLVCLRSVIYYQISNRTPGQTCLSALSELGQEGKIYLSSCAAEARRSGNTRFTIECLQRLVAGMDNDSPGEVPASTLFQYVLPFFWRMLLS